MGSTLVKKLYNIKLLDIILASILLGQFSTLPSGGKAPDIYWLDMVLIATCIVWFVKCLIKNRSFKLITFGNEKWILLYLFIVVETIPLTVDLFHSIAVAKLRVMPLLVYVIANNQIRSSYDILRFKNSLAIFGLILSIITLVNWYGFYSGAVAFSENMGFKDMAQTSWGRSNYLASIFIIIIVSSYSLYLNNRSLMLLLQIIIICAGLLATQSRGAFLSLLLGLAVMFWSMIISGNLKVVFKILIKFFVAFTIIVAILYILFPQDLWDTIIVKSLDIDSQLDASGNTNNRLSKIYDSWAAIQENPVFGIGIGNQSSIVFINGSAHNLYLETLMETGIFSLIFLLTFIISCISKLIKAMRIVVDIRTVNIACGLLAVISTSLINALEEPSFWGPQYSTIFWIFLACSNFLFRSPKKNVDISPVIISK